MARKAVDKYREQLLKTLRGMESTVAALDDEVRTSSGSMNGGNVSTTPLHLADLGSENYTQELHTTLLENEEYIRSEIVEALRRIDEGKFGICEECGTKIPARRLNAIPYARFCTKCADEQKDVPVVNLNDGRPRDWDEVFEEREAAADGIPVTKRKPSDPPKPADRHAAGTPGGGSAVGGLAGKTDPSVDLEGALGSGNFDVEIESTNDETVAYAGRAGGAVGGTPAGKRARGGRSVKK